MSVRLPDGLFLAGLLIWLLVISMLCLLPLQGPELDVPAWDKLVHAGVFAAGAVWLRLGTTSTMFLVLLVGYGALIEGLQGLMPWRSADAWDWLVDALGAGLGWLLMAGLQQRNPK